MMEELVQKLSQKTGLSPDKAQEVVNVVVELFKRKTTRTACERFG